MAARQRLLVAAAAAVAILCAMPGRALASETQQSILLDDDELVYSSPSHIANRLQQLASLGVDRVKVSIVWSLVAPSPRSSRRPNFNAADPAAYPTHGWDRYDMVARLASALRMKLYFQVIGPVPLWSVPKGESHRQGPRLGLAPRAREFNQFMRALGRRYDGTYTATVPATEPPPPPSLLGLPLSLPGGSQSAQPGASSPIPRVDEWGIWNEPNERSWLNPWKRTLSDGHTQRLQPGFYRSLVDAAWGALARTGHGHDTILIGETANRGITDLVPFIRGVYCVNRSYHLLRGEAARLQGCPTKPDRSTFVAHHPGLFYSAFAHHPYSFNVAPNKRYPNPTWITLYNISSLEHLLNRARRAYGVGGTTPLYMTEWGYKTKPPNPYARTSLAKQAEWLDEGDYMTWQRPWIHSIAQFLLVDSPPKQHTAPGSRDYWSTFQTGLILRGGRRKPAFYSYRVPIWVPRLRHGPSVFVWCQLRAADHSGVQTATVEYQPRGSASWAPIAGITTYNPEGYYAGNIAIPGPGHIRIAWRAPNGEVFHSRSNPIR